MSETALIRQEASKYITPEQNGVDIGSNGDPLFPQSISIDRIGGTRLGPLVQLRGDALNLKWFQDKSLDYVYSSHCFEDFKNEDKSRALVEWVRVIREGGYLLLYLPDQKRYEAECQRNGSRPNQDHQDPNFNIETVRQLVKDLQLPVQEVYSISKHAIYSFFLVYQVQGVRTDMPIINVIRPGAVGDVLLSSVIIRGLKQKHPGHVIHYYTRTFEAANLLAGVDAIYDSESWDKRFPGIDYYLNPYPSERGDDRPYQKHLIEYYADILQIPIDWEYSLKQTSQDKVQGRYLTIHVKTGWSIYKEWDFQNWSQTLLQLRPYLGDIQVVQIGSANDPVLSGVDIDLRGKTTLAESVALIRDAVVHLGCDSFSNHVAGGLKTPAVILFGSTSPIGSGYSTAINIWKQVECSPCYKENPTVSRHPKGSCDHHSCMKSISVEEVVRSTRQQLQIRDNYRARLRGIEGWMPSEKQKDYMFHLASESKVAAEIGTYKGLSAAVVGLGMTEGSKYYCIDTYKASSEELKRLNIDTLTEFENMKSRLQLGDKLVTVVGMSTDVVGSIPDELDFIYIDGDHTADSVYNDTRLYYQKVKKTGQILYHDYNWPGVRVGLQRCITAGLIKNLTVIDRDFVVAQPGEGVIMNSSTNRSQTICLGMIVKNEIKVLSQCFESVLPYINYWVICDTGSTDGTQDFIRDYFKSRNIPGELIERPWVDFGTNRTEVFQYCEGKADYVFVIDADDLLVGGLPDKALTADVYSLPLKSGNLNYYRPQIFKNNMDWKYLGVLHEYAESPLATIRENLEGSFYVESRRLGARNLDPQKYMKDAQTLEKGLIQEPHNSRYMFYLGQSYHNAGVYEKALEAYSKRVEAGGWTEEVFYSLYQKAQCLIQLNREFEEIVETCLKAYHVRPSRTESLHELVRYCRVKGHFYTGYMVGKFAQQIPYPSKDVLFIEPDVYKFKILDEFSICAYWVGKYRDSFDACTKLLTTEIVDKDRIRQNLEYSRQKLS